MIIYKSLFTIYSWVIQVNLLSYLCWPSFFKLDYVPLPRLLMKLWSTCLIQLQAPTILIHSFWLITKVMMYREMSRSPTIANVAPQIHTDIQMDMLRLMDFSKDQIVASTNNPLVSKDGHHDTMMMMMSTIIVAVLKIQNKRNSHNRLKGRNLLDRKVHHRRRLATNMCINHYLNTRQHIINITSSSYQIYLVKSRTKKNFSIIVEYIDMHHTRRAHIHTLTASNCDTMFYFLFLLTRGLDCKAFEMCTPRLRLHYFESLFYFIEM